MPRSFLATAAALPLAFGIYEPAASAATLPAGFTETQIATGLTDATAMAFAPDGRLFVCLQGGQLRVIKNGQLLPAPFLSVTVSSSGERGLLRYPRQRPDVHGALQAPRGTLKEQQN